MEQLWLKTGLLYLRYNPLISDASIEHGLNIYRDGAYNKQIIHKYTKSYNMYRWWGHKVKSVENDKSIYPLEHQYQGVEIQVWMVTHSHLLARRWHNIINRYKISHFGWVKNLWVSPKPQWVKRTKTVMKHQNPFVLWKWSIFTGSSQHPALSNFRSGH